MHVKNDPLSKTVLFLLALCSGLGVANVYYLQPAISLVQQDFHISESTAGWLPTATQLSYAFGMLFLSPLGDVIERRKLIVVKSVLMILSLIIAFNAKSFIVLTSASIVVGVMGGIGQDFIPVAAHMATDKNRGKIVGTVTTGLLAGILLSRTLGGWVSELYGWRAMQMLAVLLMCFVVVTTYKIIPKTEPSHSSSYIKLLSSLWMYWRKYKELRLSVVVQGLLASTLGAYWSCLAMVLASAPFHLGAGVAGTFGIAGAAGALAASSFGHLADKKGALLPIRIGCVLVIIAFSFMALAPETLWGLALGAVVFDLGVQACLVSHQTLVSGIDPIARGRLNGLLMTGAMIGMAVGAALGVFLWAHVGKVGLFGFGAVAGLLALIGSLLHDKRQL